MSGFPSESRAPARASFGTNTGELTSGLLGKVFGLLTFCFAFAAAGGVFSTQLGTGWFLPLFIAQIALTFAVTAARDKEGINLVLLYATTFVTGIFIGFIVQSYVDAGAGKAVLQAAGVTGVMTVGLSAYALTTKRDFSGLAPILFIALLGLFAANILNIWVGGNLLYTIVSWVGAMLFSVMLIFEVNRTRYMPDTMGNAVVLTLGIFLSIINLFISVLRILQGSRN